MAHADIAVRSDGSRINVVTQWTEKELVRAVPSSRWDPDDRVWTVPLSWAACLQLRGLFGDTLSVGHDLAVWSQRELAERINPALALRERIDRVDSSDLWSWLLDFQTAGAEWLLAAGDAALLADDMGLGKTIQILAALEALLGRLSPEDALPALVICPNGVKSGWAREVRDRRSSAVPYVVEGGAVERRKILERARTDPHALVIVNIESVRLFSRLAPYGSVRLARCRECSTHGEQTLTPSRCEVHTKEFNRFAFKTVIVDEAHALKDPKSKQTRAVWAVAHQTGVCRRWALTGTPVANHVGDLWGIMHAVAPHEYPVKSKFVDRYALQSWNAFGGMDIVGVNPATREEFYRILDPRFRRTPKHLVLTQLPTVVRPTRWVRMSAKQERAYRELEKRLVTRLDTGEVLLAPNQLVKGLRLLQLASSYGDVKWVPQPLTVLSRCPCYGAGLSAHDPACGLAFKIQVKLAEPSPKLDAVMADLEVLGTRQVVIAAESRQLIELLARRLDKSKTSYGMLTGAVPDYEREAHRRAFVSGDVRLMLLTIGAGGTGVDGLQVADTMLVLQRSYNMLTNLQLDGRVHRIGSEKHNSVTIVDYVTEDTIEETTLYPRLRDKWERLEEINRDRARLTAAGLSPEQRFELDRRENALQNAWLGEP